MKVGVGIICLGSCEHDYKSWRSLKAAQQQLASQEELHLADLMKFLDNEIKVKKNKTSVIRSRKWRLMGLFDVYGPICSRPSAVRSSALHVGRALPPPPRKISNIQFC
jgi:hypothetical protein